MSYFVLGNLYWTSNLLEEIHVFGTLKMFSPRRDSVKRTEGGPIFFYFPFYCGLRRVIDTFNLQTKIRKKNLIMFFLMGWDMWMGWDGVCFMSFNCIRTLWVYR